MKIGILDAYGKEHPELFTKEPVKDKFHRLFDESDASFECVDYSLTDHELPVEVDECDGQWGSCELHNE